MGNNIFNKNNIEYTCSYCNKCWHTTKSAYTMHENHCIKNPNRKEYRSHPQTKETRQLISDKMKIAHKEGRAWHYAKNGRRSYPEQWFKNVIENTFDDKNFTEQLPCNGYFIDFAWVHKMRCIEIDDEQHNNTVEYDKKRDDKLSEIGWTILRIKWIDCFNNPKQCIEIAKQFINNGIIVPYEKRYKSKKELHEEYMLNKYNTKKLKREQTTEEKWQRQLSIIKNYDITKDGWIDTIITETDLSYDIIKKTCKHFNINYNKKTAKHKKNILTDEQLENRLQLLINSNINFMKHGWINKFEILTGVTRRQTVRLKKYMDKLGIEYNITKETI